MNDANKLEETQSEKPSCYFAETVWPDIWQQILEVAGKGNDFYKDLPVVNMLDNVPFSI